MYIILKIKIHQDKKMSPPAQFGNLNLFAGVEGMLTGTSQMQMGICCYYCAVNWKYSDLMIT